MALIAQRAAESWQIAVLRGQGHPARRSAVEDTDKNCSHVDWFSRGEHPPVTGPLPEEDPLSGDNCHISALLEAGQTCLTVILGDCIAIYGTKISSHLIKPPTP